MKQQKHDSTEEKEAEKRTLRDLLKDASQMRMRHQLVPPAVIAALHAGAAAAHAGVATGSETGESLAWGISGVYIVLAAACWVWHDWTHRENRKSRRRYTTLVFLSGLTWFATAVLTGADSWVGAAVWIGGFALSYPYWRAHSIPIPPEEETQRLTPEPHRDAEKPSLVRLWERYVASPKGALTGAALKHMRNTKAGPEFLIQLRRGEQTTATALAASPLIASALGCGIDRVVIDRVAGNESQAKLLVATGDNPVEKTHMYNPARIVYDPKQGAIPVGIHPDGEQAQWDLWVPEWGLAGGIVIGSVGGGKSAFMTSIALSAARTEFISVWAADPQGGQSFPSLLTHASWAATDTDEIMRQLASMEKIIKIRGTINGLLGRALHEPTPDEPCILLILDEIHRLTDIKVDNAEAARLVEFIAREGRKAGVAIIAADQSINMDTFYNSDAMRSNLMIRNCAVFRTASKSTRTTVPGLNLDPSTLPERFPDGSPTSGLGYQVGRRTAPFRSYWLPEDSTDTALGADAQFSKVEMCELEQISAEHIGEDYTKRHERALEKTAETVEELASISPEAIERIFAHKPELRSAIKNLPPRSERRFTQQRATTRRTSSGTVLSSIPAAPEFHPPAPPTPRVLTTEGGQRVYELVCDGVSAPSELQTRAELSEARVRAVLKELAHEGLVYKIRHGVWTATHATPFSPATNR